MERISRKELYKEMALLISKRSSCLKKQVGALLIRENRVIAMGYNGVLPKIPASHGIDPDGTTYTVHAEINIIAFCAKHGINTKGATLIVTLSPCEKCAEAIIQSGIERVGYIEEYRCLRGLEVLRQCGVDVYQL